MTIERKYTDKQLKEIYTMYVNCDDKKTICQLFDIPSETTLASMVSAYRITLPVNEQRTRPWKDKNGNPLNRYNPITQELVALIHKDQMLTGKATTHYAEVNDVAYSSLCDHLKVFKKNLAREQKRQVTLAEKRSRYTPTTVEQEQSIPRGALTTSKDTLKKGLEYHLSAINELLNNL